MSTWSTPRSTRHDQHWTRISEGVASDEGWDLALGLHVEAF